MEKETYNGYCNRSTWLAHLWLCNSSEDIYKKSLELKEKWIEMLNYWQDIKNRDHTSYSYPFHQHKAIEKELKELLSKTYINNEQDYSFRKINQEELFNNL